jgi:hypothetical protein
VQVGTVLVEVLESPGHTPETIGRDPILACDSWAAAPTTYISAPSLLKGNDSFGCADYCHKCKQSGPEGEIVKKIWILTFCTVLAVMATTASYADALHGYCVSPAARCNDNRTITPTGDNPPYFAFSYSGSHATNSELWLIGLVPDNKNTGFGLTLAGTNTTDPSATGSLFSKTEWNSGTLQHYLTFFSWPHGVDHPLSAYQDGAKSAGLNAPNGYFAYLFDFGLFDYKTATGDPEFSVSKGAVPQGMLFLEVQANADHRVLVDTPNSPTLIETKTMSTVPEPGSMLLLGSGLIGTAGVLRRKLMN